MRVLFLYQMMLVVAFLLGSPAAGWAQSGAAQQKKIAKRYVNIKTGSFGNDGRSWQTARNDLQATINELYAFVESNSDYSVGHIYVAGGTVNNEPLIYRPTESTGEDNTGVFFTAFKMRKGIEVYGGFNPDPAAAEMAPDDRKWTFDEAKGWELLYPTILTGTHTRGAEKFEWNKDMSRYVMSFPKNSYHVVWFATGVYKDGEGKTHSGFDDKGRAYPLEKRAVLDGFIIQGGNSNNSNTDQRMHTSYGGGVYMVGNAVLRNCEVRHCHATRGGAGVYLDGGGRVEDCYIHTNQCEGVGLQEGYGGGVCVADSGLVTRCIIVDNMARIGGGLALVHSENPADPTSPGDPIKNPEKINRYVASASATVVACNTASTEAGGLLLMNGGTVNQMTIAHNRCSGGEMIINDRKYGLSGGAYVENVGVLFNSVLYGNKVGYSNLQYASHGGNVKTNNRPYMHYGAVENYEKTDWSGTRRRGVIPVYKETYQDKDHPEFVHMPREFFKPQGAAESRVYERAGVQAGGTYSEENMKLSKNAELGNLPEKGTMVELTEEELRRRFEYYWLPEAASPMRSLGVKLRSFITDPSMHYAETDMDLNRHPVSAKPTLGAFNAKAFNFVPTTLVPSMEGKGETVYTLFVDPNLKSSGNDAAVQDWGDSWDHPMLYLDDALEYVRQVRQGNTNIQSDAVFQILMKEGKGTTASNHFKGDLHTAYIGMVDRTRLYGSFPKELTGTSLTMTKVVDRKNVQLQRNPKLYPTILSADVMELGETRNSDHVVIFDGVSEAVLDGFHIERGYAMKDVSQKGTTVYEPHLKNGAGILVVNTTTKPVMTGNVVRNCRVANCTAEEGAAIWVKAGVDSKVQNSQMALDLVNCIFHNNTGMRETQATSVVYLGAEAGHTLQVNMDHCNIVKNVGRPVVTTPNGVTLKLANSIVWANTKKEMKDSEDLETTGSGNILRFGVQTSSLTLNNCALDRGTPNIQDQESKNILDYERNMENFPTFVNPTKNIGAVYGADQTYYGGRVDFTPRNMNPLVNSANDDMSAAVATDFTGIATRDYGGAADIGAIENTELPKLGKVIYVRDYRTSNGQIDLTKGGDGSSWEKAINGNAVYVNDHGFQGVDAELYHEGASLTGLQWAVDEAYYRSLKKSNENIVYTDAAQLKGEVVYAGHNTNFDEKDIFEAQAIRISEVDKEQLVLVWVAAGEYIRPEGFFMRNSVDVLGGFPKTGNPGMMERNPRAPQNETIIETNPTGNYKFGPQRGDANNKSGDLIKEKFSYGDRIIVGGPGDDNNSGIDHNRLILAMDGNLATGNGVDMNVPSYRYFESHFNMTLGDFKTQMSSVTLKGIKSNDREGNTYTVTVYYQDNSGKWVEAGSTQVSISSSTNPVDWNLDLTKTTQPTRFLRFEIESGWKNTKRNFHIQEIIVESKAQTVEQEIPDSRYYDLNAYENAYYSRRVLTQPYPYYSTAKINEKPVSMEYLNIALNPFDTITSWDGFTIQNGRTQIAHQRDGGAGVALRHNGRIINCVVRNNINSVANYNQRGGGIFCNGGEIVNCLVEDNHGKVRSTESRRWSFGGGLYLRLGTVYNTCFAKNSVSSQNGVMDNEYSGGSGVFFENGTFYNNTITENTGRYALETGNYFEEGSIQVYNSILYNNHNNNGYGQDMRAHTKLATITHCLFAASTSYDVSGVVPESMKYGNPNFVDAVHGDYSLQSNSDAINAGNDAIKGVTLPKFDAHYDDRIQDCRVDIGAFEYNGAKDIKPTVDDQARQLIFFVSQNGNAKGDMSGNRENPVCASKFQKVLDAAGRLRRDLLSSQTGTKYEGKEDYEIVIRLAGNASSGFAYSPQRSTDAESGNPRTFSLIIPHGITLEGGWNEDFKERNITKYPTILSGIYQADGLDVDVYHVLTFTNNVYDVKEQSEGGNLNALSSVSHKTILDGLYLEDGRADGEVLKHQNGGVAIVPEYGHVRNCILKNNLALKDGGALHLQPKALVSGCLFVGNEAENGGAISVAMKGEDLENNQPGKESADVPAVPDMAHVFTSTMVDNKANGAGGAVWFDNNVRVNSTVMWKNTASVDMNVSGQTNPNSTVNQDQTLEFYPLAYCAVENIRVPGLNNIKVNSANEEGVRFEMEPKTTNILEYYGPTSYSVLGRAGMPVTDYNALSCPDSTKFKNLTQADFMGILRGVKKDKDQHEYNNQFIEIGARAFDGELIVKPTQKFLLRRLYVSQSNVDWAKVQSLEHMEDAQHQIYKLKGSSFAYPMQHLDDALEYIREARKNTKLTVTEGEGKNQKTIPVKNVRFEVFVSNGTYYPFHNIQGVYDKSRAATFLVPEGVSIYGGMDNSIFYGQNKPESDNTNGDITLQVPDPEHTNEFIDVKLLRHPTSKMLKSRSNTVDRNINGIIEPWEMDHQTILSGNVVEKADNVHHIVTCMPYGVGELPDLGAYGKGSEQDRQKGVRPTFNGMEIVFDGLEFVEGEALKKSGDENDSQNRILANYAERGGAILVAGNVGKLHPDQPENNEWGWVGPAGQNLKVDAVGKRNIPLTVRNCRFNGNAAGEGGAIFTDSELKIYSSSFERNHSEKSGNFMGNGGAVAANYEMTIVNTIFENNQAGYIEDKEDAAADGVGGAVFTGANGWTHILNCNVVRNLAKSYPGFYFMTPNHINRQMGGQGVVDADAEGADRHAVVNTLFWGNEVKKGGIPFIVRYADPEGNELKTFETVNDRAVEVLWFSAYENGLGKKPNAALIPGVDMRKASFDFEKGAHYIPNVFRAYLNDEKFSKVSQEDKEKIIHSNYNVWLNTENNDLNGPNFSNPSKRAGNMGYDASSSWMVTRPNNLTDNGWTSLEQTSQFNDKLWEYEYTFTDPLQGQGIYFDLFKQKDNADTLCISLGNHAYMHNLAKEPVKRISLTPSGDAKESFIDIGVYEYRQIPLNPVDLNMKDVLWVCENERNDVTEADGSSMEKATSDLQRAIETLLSDRNGRHKEIRLLGGTYTPKYTLNAENLSNSGFLINTKNQDNSAQVPGVHGQYGVASLAFRGGWSDQVREYRDLMDFQSVVCTTPSGESTASQFKYLFYIKDALQRTSYQLDQNGTKIESKAQNFVVPIIFDGVTFCNEFAADTKGSAIYYAQQLQEKPKGNPDAPDVEALAPQVPKYMPNEQNDFAELPKLSITRCRFVRNGSEKEKSGQQGLTSAVTIERGGGKALVYNSIFHSNRDYPLQAANTDVLNCTFALNGREVQLAGEHSGLYNSVLWKNNLILPEKTNFGEQLLIDGNGYEGWKDNASVTFNAVQGIPDEGTTNHNVNITEKNADLIEGPNFENPDEQAQTEEAVNLRKFTLLPSIRLLNAGDAATYCQVLFKHFQYGAGQVNKKYNAVKEKMLKALRVPVNPGDETFAYSTDLVNNTRLVDRELDRGAYEYQHPLRRVVYVDPKRPPGDGTSWEKAYSMSQMQDAIDMAAVYAYNQFLLNKPEKHAHAYVFMKGSDVHTKRSLTMRAGVSIYGSIAENFGQMVHLQNKEKPDALALDQFVKVVRNERPGLVEPRVQRTVVSGIRVSEDCRGHESLVDGLEIAGTPENDGSLEKITSPAVDFYLKILSSEVSPTTGVVEPGPALPDEGQLAKKTLLVMRNCVIGGFHNTTTTNYTEQAVARFNHALMYNCLVHNNKVDGDPHSGAASLMMGNSGYMVNNTIVTDDQTTVPLYLPATSSKNVQRTIVYPGRTSAGALRANPFCGYFDQPEYVKVHGRNPYLRYQLGEKAPEVENKTPWVMGVVDKYGKFIQFDTDRDLLGNPRRVGGHVDIGCFETWSTHGQALDINTDREEETFGGHHYPHEGSVVYLDNAMNVTGNLQNSKKEAITIRPGYFLLQQGGGWYGHGVASLELSYAAVERELGLENLVSLPFDYNYSEGCQQVAYAGGALQLTDVMPASVQSYDREARAVSSYRYSPGNNSCWNDKSPGLTTANEGVSFALRLGQDNKMYRFTAWAPETGKHVYVEGSTPKTVDLHQAQNQNLVDGKPEFTIMENMGWNLVGMPYMVTDYGCGGNAQTASKYMMDVPHLIYELTPEYSYAPVESWQKSALAHAGHAFFTQTSVIRSALEKLRFAIPTEASSASLNEGKRLTFKGTSGGDEVIARPNAETAQLTYRWGADGVKWMSDVEEMPQVYLESAAGTRFSLASAVPVATELKLGVRAMNGGNYTFALPERDAFGDFSHVWLADHEEGWVADLKHEDYTITLDEALDSPERFTLKFGGTAPVLENRDGRGLYETFIRNGKLHILGLQGGEQIHVYDVAGRDVHSGVGQPGIYTAPLPTGIYVVKINRCVYKVR